MLSRTEFVHAPRRTVPPAAPLAMPLVKTRQMPPEVLLNCPIPKRSVVPYDLLMNSPPLEASTSNMGPVTALAIVILPLSDKEVPVMAPAVRDVAVSAPVLTAPFTSNLFAAAATRPMPRLPFVSKVMRVVPAIPNARLEPDVAFSKAVVTVPLQVTAVAVSGPAR